MMKYAVKQQQHSFFCKYSREAETFIRFNQLFIYWALSSLVCLPRPIDIYYLFSFSLTNARRYH